MVVFVVIAIGVAGVTQYRVLRLEKQVAEIDKGFALTREIIVMEAFMAKSVREKVNRLEKGSRKEVSK